MATDNDETTLTDRIRDRARQARRRRQRKKAEREFKRKKKQKQKEERRANIKEAAGEVKGAVTATRPGAIAQKTGAGLSKIVSKTADAVEAPADSDRTGDGDNGGGMSLGDIIGGDETQSFDRDDAAFADVDRDGEAEALFGEFGADSETALFDTDGDGDPDVLFGAGGGQDRTVSELDVAVEQAEVTVRDDDVRGQGGADDFFGGFGADGDGGSHPMDRLVGGRDDDDNDPPRLI